MRIYRYSNKDFEEDMRHDAEFEEVWEMRARHAAERGEGEDEE